MVWENEVVDSPKFIKGDKENDIDYQASQYGIRGEMHKHK